MTIRLLELYTSVQGEGPNVGKPIQFIRFAGCNMRCPGWPCDTPQAIYPEQFKNEQQIVHVHDLMEAIKPYPKHVCLTGGEPFLQHDLPSLWDRLLVDGYEVDIFTNGSRLISQEFMYGINTTIVMDWKLYGSGEANSFLEVRTENLKRLTKQHAVKFVVNDMTDYKEAIEVYYEYISPRQEPPEVFVGRVWNGDITDAEIVEAVTRDQLPWRLNRQEHNYIWPAHERFR